MFVRNRRELVVDCYPPRRVKVLWAALVVLLVALAWAIGIYAPGQVATESSDWNAQKLDLMGRLAASETERVRLASTVEKFTRVGEVSNQAYATLQKDFDGLQRQLLSLREELAFYQAVTTSGKSAAGVKVQRFLVKPDGTTGGFVYTLVLVQSKNSNKTVEGTVRFRIHGSREGRPAELSLSDFSDPPVSALKVRFRYFQDLSGSITLPPGFLPDRLRIEIDLGKPHQDIKKSYSWSELQS